MRASVTVALSGAMLTLIGLTSAGCAAAPVTDVGQRVEVTSLGMALTLADDWTYVFPTSEMMDEVTRSVVEDESFDPALTEQAELVASGYVETVLLMFPPARRRARSHENCVLISLPGQSLSLEAAVRDNLAFLAGIDSTEPPSVAYVDLPIGRAARIEFTIPGFPEVASTYLFEGEASHISLTCQALDRQDEDWLAIAETLEFLPAQE